MRIWLAKSSEVPVREQLATQIMLGVVSGELAPGQRLPSTRELARRFGIHSNTVSAAYRQLESHGWLEARKGSGVYVRNGPDPAPADGRYALDCLIADLFRAARAQGHTLPDIRARLRHWLQLQPPDHFLVIEPSPELRVLLIAEIQENHAIPVHGAHPREAAALLDGAVPVALLDEADQVRAALPPGTDVLLLHSRSLAEALQGQRRPAPDEIVAVVSHWPDFLRWSRTILVAAGLSPDALVFYDTRVAGWDRGLRASTVVITESLTARKIPGGFDVRVFRLIADAALTEIRRLAGQMVAGG